MINKKNIGKKIKEARMNKHYTQEQLAEIVDISTNYLSKIERGLNSTTAETFLKIVKALDLDMSDFGIISNDIAEEEKSKLISNIITSDSKTIKILTPIIEDILSAFDSIKSK